MADDIRVKITVDDKGLLKHLKKLADTQKKVVQGNKELVSSGNKVSASDKKLLELAKEQRIAHQNQLDVERQRTKEIKRRLKLKEEERLKKLKKAEKDLIQTRKLAVKQMNLMTSSVKAAGTSFKKIGINTRTLNQALQGNVKALAQVRKAMTLANIKMKQMNAGMFATITNGRLLSNSFATIRSKLLLISFAIGLVTAGVLRQVQAFAKQEESVLKIARVFGTSAAKELNEYSSQLQEITRFGDENINILMSQIGAFGANKEQTKELTKATLNLAEGLGVDLNTAGLLVAKTSGSTTDALGRYGIKISGTMSRQEKFIAITQGINEKFADLAELMAKTTSGQLAQASNAFGDLQERLGEALAPAVLTVAKALKALVEAVPVAAFRLLINLVVGLTVSFSVYKAILVAVALKAKLAALGIDSISAALARSRIALAKSGWGVVVIAIGAIIGALMTWWQSTRGLTEEQEKLNKRIDEIADSMQIAAGANKELIQSIMDNEDAIAKKIAIVEAELTLTGRALEIKLSEIELGRELTHSEKQLMSVLKNKLNLKTRQEESDKRELELTKNLEQAHRSTIDGQIASLETIIFAANRKNILTNNEIAGLKELQRQLDSLYAKRAADPSAIAFEKSIKGLNDQWHAMEKYEEIIKSVDVNLGKSGKVKEDMTDEEIKLAHRGVIAWQKYGMSWGAILKDTEETSVAYKQSYVELKQELEEDIAVNNIENILLKQRRSTEGLTQVEMLLRESRMKGVPINKEVAQQLLDYEAATKEIVETQQKQLDVENKLISLGSKTIDQRIEQIDAEIALSDAIKNKNAVQLAGHQALLDMKDKLEAKKKNEAANDKASWMVTKKINQDKMGIVSDNFKNLAALNEASKGSAIFTATLQAIAAGIDAHKAAGSAYAQAPLGFKTAAATAAYAAGIARMVSIYQGVSQLKGTGSPKHTAKEGGYVNGQPHSAGGTIIEAEQGEFIMSKAAVDSIGLETVNAMNQSGSTGNINVNISGNVMTRDFVEGELAESIKEAVRRGSDFGFN